MPSCREQFRDWDQRDYSAVLARRTLAGDRRCPATRSPCIRSPLYARVQLTLGFQSLNMPLGLGFQSQACSA